LDISSIAGPTIDAMILLFPISVVFIVGATALYLTRSRWLHRVPDFELPGRDYLYSRLPSTFHGDVEAGLSSSTFDLSGNIESGDGRAGLDDESKREILKIMKKRRMKFDDARRVLMENRFKANGIGADGRPRDPKFVSFS
jgi:hypothetical protein